MSGICNAGKSYGKTVRVPRRGGPEAVPVVAAGHEEVRADV